MRWFKRKDGSVFGKASVTADQVKAYKKDGCVECDEKGKAVNKRSKSKPKHEVHRAE